MCVCVGCNAVYLLEHGSAQPDALMSAARVTIIKIILLQAALIFRGGVKKFSVPLGIVQD